MSREIALIVAHDRQRAIGVAGQLPWRLPDDLKHFKALTLGHTVVMGRRTFESIGKPLPGRRNWVLSRDPDLQIPGVDCFGSWAHALRQHKEGLLWVIGGGEIYLSALADVERIESTEIKASISAADTWFPPLPDQDWDEISRRPHPADERHAFAFDLVTRVRRRS